MTDDRIKDPLTDADRLRMYAAWGKCTDAMFMEELADRIEALEADQAWRPIETAPPKDDVLLYFPAVYRLGDWSQITHHPMLKIGMAAHFPNRPPTHWMPLPQPPGADHD